MIPFYIYTYLVFCAQDLFKLHTNTPNYLDILLNSLFVRVVKSELCFILFFFSIFIFIFIYFLILNLGLGFGVTSLSHHHKMSHYDAVTVTSSHAHIIQ